MHRTRSLWQEEEFDPVAALDGDLAADVVVVGAGMAGLSIAYHLARTGVNVIVLDRARPGAGMSSLTTAHLSFALDDRYQAFIERRGLSDARIAAASHRAAVDSIETIQREEDIACDFTRLDGYLYPAPGDGPKVLRDECDAAHQAGLTAVELCDPGPVTLDTGSFCLRFPHQGRMHPVKYLRGLQRCILRDGGQIFRDAQAVSVSGRREAVVRTADGHVVTGRHVVVATNSPINSMTIHTKQAPYRTYVVAAPIARGTFPDALIWDNRTPYHYVRLQPGSDTHDYVIAGGEDHKTGHGHDQRERIGRLHDWLRSIAPRIGDIEYAWSGQVLETHDFIGFIGRQASDIDNVYEVTGDSGMGMTHGALAGLIIPDLIRGEENSWTELYDPGRVTPKAAGTFIRENMDAVSHFRDYVTGGDIAHAEDLKPGQGAVVREGTHKVAAFRDDDGRLHRCSAVCHHMNCLVAWNPFERTWDCPCHGSIYDADGSLINGPAVTGLTRLGQAKN